MLKVLEIDFHLEYIRTTNTADFKNSKNPSTPVIQSADNINAPPIFSITQLYVIRKLKVHDLKKVFLEFFCFLNIDF